MCNLYRMTKNPDEVARWFDAVADLTGSNAPEEIYPGAPGLVVAGGRVRQMAWGFPLARIGAKGQALKPRPVNNTRADKLGGRFWAAAFRDRRCLIPVDRFAEAQGAKGAKTRIWLALGSGEPMAVAGIWRPTDEWGDAYSMVMTEGCVAMGDIHDRMPVIVPRVDWATWTDGPPDAAQALCRPYPGALAIDRTAEPWAGWPAGAQPALDL